ncbi:hypothetical protein N9955_00255 [bacterium]|nr:hypothetical protein [bacterium]
MKDFDKYLIEKYPNLFPKDEDGNIRQPDCGIYCPEGWEFIVDNLCGCINACVKQYSNEQIKKFRYKVKLWFYRKTVNKICYKLCKIFDPYKNHPRNFMTQEEKKTLDRENEFELVLNRKIRKIEDWFRPRYDFKKVYPDKVTISQIKEKFGGLRFYYSGGDEAISGMVCLAEQLSYRTCERCGQKGELDQSKNWMITLCEDCKKEK